MYFLAGPRRTYRFWRRLYPMIREYWAFLSRMAKLEKEAEEDDDDNSKKQKKKKAVLRELRERESERLALKWAPRVAQSFLDLGGFYVKAAQHLHSFPMLPPAYAEAFAPLRSGVAPRPRGDLEPLLPPELKLDVDWSAPPLGAASVGQVHAGVFFSDDDERQKKVAVKFQYPEVASEFPADLGCVSTLVKLLARAQGLAIPNEQLNEVLQTFLQELDFHQEATNLRDIADAVRRLNLKVKVPEPLFSSKYVLVMDLVDGRPLSQLLREEQAAVAKVMGTTTDNLDNLRRDAQRQVIDLIRNGTFQGGPDDDEQDGEQDGESSESSTEKTPKKKKKKNQLDTSNNKKIIIVRGFFPGGGLFCCFCFTKQRGGGSDCSRRGRTPHPLSHFSCRRSWRCFSCGLSGHCCTGSPSSGGGWSLGDDAKTRTLLELRSTRGSCATVSSRLSGG